MSRRGREAATRSGSGSRVSPVHESLLLGATHAIRQVLLLHQSKLDEVDVDQFSKDVREVVKGEFAKRVFLTRVPRHYEEEDGGMEDDEEGGRDRFKRRRHDDEGGEEEVDEAPKEAWQARPHSYRQTEVGILVREERERASAGLVPVIDAEDRRFIYVDVPPMSAKPYVEMLRLILYDDAYAKDRRDDALKTILKGLKDLKDGTIPAQRVRGLNKTPLAKDRRKCYFCGWFIEPEFGDLDYPFYADLVFASAPESLPQHPMHASCLAVLRGSGWSRCFCPAYNAEPRTCVKQCRDAQKVRRAKLAAEALLLHSVSRHRPQKEEEEREEEQEGETRETEETGETGKEKGGQAEETVEVEDVVGDVEG